MLLVALSVSLVWLMQHESMQIHSVEVFGATAISEEEVVAKVDEKLAGTYLSIIPRQNILFYPKADITAAVSQAFPRAKDITVSRRGLGDIEISFTERKPAALWCGDIVPYLERGNDTVSSYNEDIGMCYFIDETGFIFSAAPRFTGSPLPRYFGSLKKGEVSGQQFLEPSEFTLLQQFQSLLTEKQYQLGGLLVLDEETLEVYLLNGPRLVVLRYADYAAVLENLDSILRSPQFSDPSYFRNLEYIDLRFGSKVYIKPFTSSKEEL